LVSWRFSLRKNDHFHRPNARLQKYGLSWIGRYPLQKGTNHIYRRYYPWLPSRNRSDRLRPDRHNNLPVQSPVSLLGTVWPDYGTFFPLSFPSLFFPNGNTPTRPEGHVAPRGPRKGQGYKYYFFLPGYGVHDPWQ